jgi:RsiW-degrading membrane proteinase PrsW (M82 family)
MEILIGLLAVILLAFVPMALYSLVLWWFDRYEREPVGLLIVAFLWGAIPAIIFSVIAQLIFEIPISILVGRNMGAQLIGAGLVAPLTEEPFKGLALLLLLLLFRREIDTPLDGIVYGGLVGFGFAATENALYFLGEFGMSGLTGVLGLAFFRAVIFGLNHALFTACTGLGFALAHTSPNKALRFSAPILGLAAGTALHAIHNIGASLGSALCWPLVISVVSDWGGVLAFLGILLWISYRERRWISKHLEDEVDAGTIGPQDYQIIQSYWRRLRNRVQALFQGDPTRWRRLGKYYRLATELAFLKQRQKSHGDEKETTMQIEERRRELYSLRKEL